MTAASGSGTERMVASSRKHQQGVSLISLMIGLLISLIAVMGMMALYRTVVHTTAESGSYARMSGDRSAAVLTAHVHLQEAGFGIDEASLGADLAFCSANLAQGQLTVGSCSTGRRGKLLLWRTQTSGERCAGLYITPAGDLQYLQPRPCAGAELSGSWQEQDRARLYTKSLDGAVFESMEVIEERCQALGVAGAGSLKVNLIAHHPVAEAYDAANPDTFLPINSSSCLINFQ
ncbi:hypothetical protein HG264_09360 [Pseudomonas sp. gcc21]|uniref:PilW family protein n=1 Tax=Pseudomonas sp. gcc21 TaxID=2726989 RepID=UPI00145186BC|nr:hypothetical protein [Pseudomonas sp. gcc21]QJD59104.1 hypothetical protein HG264_09360 [Pseudomonas sp. gcc21]